MEERLFKLFILPTRIYHESLLNLIATNNTQNITQSGILSSNLSDHELVLCVCKPNWKRLPVQIRMLRYYANYKPANFCDDLLKGVNWDSCIPISNIEVLNGSNVDNLWVNFKQAFTTVPGWHAPVMTNKGTWDRL